MVMISHGGNKLIPSKFTDCGYNMVTVSCGKSSIVFLTFSLMKTIALGQHRVLALWLDLSQLSCIFLWTRKPIANSFFACLIK